MRKHGFGNNSNAFLLEILLNILLFAILLTVSMRLILKAHTLTSDTREEYKATEVCQSLADLYESGNGSLTALSSFYPEATVSESGFYLKLDSDFLPAAEVSDSETSYNLVALPVDSSELSFHGQAVDISLTNQDGEEIFSLRACHFDQASPSDYDTDGDKEVAE